MSKGKYESNVLPRLDEIEAWARDGVSDEDIARNLAVAYSTFRRYKETHQALSAALARGKDYVDNVIVTNAYLRRITGYDTTETRREYVYVQDPGGGEPVRMLSKETEQVRHIPGDPRAAEFWLVNRQKLKWRRPGDTAGQDADSVETGVVELPAVQDLTPPTGIPTEGSPCAQ